MSIDTDKFSTSLRAKAIRLKERQLLITRLNDSEQEQDISEPINCEGVGRIRHFRRNTSEGWPPNPLPIDPACQHLGLQRCDMIRAQVFQNAACNWRCWYCFVPFPMLNSDESLSRWLSADDLLDLLRKEDDAPRLIDLSGGQPDLTPEWVPWMMQAIKRRGLDSSYYLWSDDNLSNDYFWRYLSPEDIQLVAEYENYGKVCCFKGFNGDSFSFNTKAAPDLFDRQFELFKRYHDLGLDIYGYATFTCTEDAGIAGEVERFVNRLQEISPNMPLRIVPLEIKVFSPVQGRITEIHERAMKLQWAAIDAWKNELNKRFDESLRALPINSVPL